MPKIRQPFARSSCTILASSPVQCPSYLFDPYSVGISFVAKISLMATGKPNKADFLSFIGTASNRCASLIIKSGSMKDQALTFGSSSARERQALAKSSILSRPSRMACAASVAEGHLAQQSRREEKDRIDGGLAEEQGRCRVSAADRNSHVWRD